jgi:hypothetical protein
MTRVNFPQPRKHLGIILMCLSVPFFAVALADGLTPQKSCDTAISKVIFSNSCKLPDEPQKAV